MQRGVSISEQKRERHRSAWKETREGGSESNKEEREGSEEEEGDGDDEEEGEEEGAAEGVLLVAKRARKAEFR